MIKRIEDVYKILFDTKQNNFEFYSEKDELLFSIERSKFLEIIKDYSPPKKLIDIFREAGEQVEIIRIHNSDVDIINEFDNNPAYIRRNINLDTSKPELYSEYVLNPDSELPSEYKEQVFIYLPASEIPLLVTEKLTNACGEFMEALGFELELENEPIYGSFIQNMLFRIKEGTKLTQREIAKDFSKGKKALELKYVELPTAEQTEKLANSASKIVELLKGQDEGVVRLGALLVLKKQIDGKSKVIIQQLNFDLISILDKSPQLLQNLQTVYELITGDVKVAIKDDTYLPPSVSPSTGIFPSQETGV